MGITSSFVQSVSNHLSDNNMDVRIAAAKCLAFIYELVLSVVPLPSREH